LKSKVKAEGVIMRRIGEKRRALTTQPVAVRTEEIRPAGMAGRLQLLQIPLNIIQSILETKYLDGKEMKPLFGLAVNKETGEWAYRHQEIAEIVHVYETMRTTVSATTGNVLSEDEVFVEFDRYIKALAVNREKKTAADVLVTDDTVFESPLLIEMRRQEMLKDNLLNRRKVPIKGPGSVCGKCKSDEAFQSEKYIRSGDEGAVWINECAKCGNKWNA
jgi:DNA-directed RNA polymerase subunit M/transcription elongation factor TFIIS